MVNLEVGWEVARDRAFADIVQKGTALARPELGHSVHVDVNGLEPARDYFYRFRAGREVSQIGRTRTAPAAGASVDTLRFAMVGCNHYETGYFTAFRRIAEDNVDFVFHTGDYIYEGRDDGGRHGARPATRGCRRSTRSSTTGTATRSTRWIATCAPRTRRRRSSSRGTTTRSTTTTPAIATRQDTPPEVFLLRRAAAYQAFYESMPLRAGVSDRPGPQAVSAADVRHRCVDFSVLDTRQYRSNQACEGGAKPAAPSARPSRTMLGTMQERGCSRSSPRRAHAGPSSVSRCRCCARHLGPGSASGRFSMDKWDGYPASRARLIARLVETRAPNPIVLSGDVHVHYGADLKRDFSRPESATIGAEFTNTSATSGGDGADVRANWEQMRADQPAHQVPQRAPRLRRVHGHAGDVPRGLQDDRSGDRARRHRTHRRVPRGRGRASRGVDGVAGQTPSVVPTPYDFL